MPGVVLGGFLVAACSALYLIFLRVQTMRHRSHFMQPGEQSTERGADDAPAPKPGAAIYHAAFLILTMIPIVLLSNSIARIIDHGIEGAGLPAALGGLLVAVLVVSPEGLAAIKAALANKLQRSINISMGSGLATISLTVPAVLLISMYTDRVIELGLDDLDIVLLALTLGTMIVNASSKRTNVMQGVTHLTLFAAYLVLMFD